MKVILVILLLSLFACETSSPEYKAFRNDISYKLIQLGDGVKPKAEEIVQLKLMISTSASDTLYYVPNYSYFIPMKNHVLDSVWQQFNVGDSVQLKINRNTFNDYLKLYKVLQSKADTVFLNVKIENSYDDIAAEMAQKELLSKRELDEQRKLMDYLGKIEDSLVDLGGVYKQMLKHSEIGNEIKAGSQVSIHYKGSFLNGFIFDNTYEKSITPSFTYGQEYQMIDGLRTALKGMKEGESVKIILPSRHAFGEEGSLAGIVPPYTAVIYEVNIIKVIN